MNNKALILITALGVALPTLGTSQAATLSEVYRLASQNAPQIRSASAGLDAARQALPLSEANQKPNVSLGASAIANTNRLANDYGSASITVTQSLYNPANDIAVDSAQSAIAVAEAEYASTGQRLIMDVSTAYFNVLAAQDGVEFAQAEQEANARQLEQTKQRFEVGLIAITDVHESQAAFDISVARTIAAENALNNALEQLRELTGRYVDTLQKLDARLPLDRPNPSDPAAWTDMALENNPLLQAAERRTEQARLAVDAADAIDDPTAAFTVQGTGTVDGPASADGISAVLSLNYPLYDGDRTKASVSQARALLRQSQELYEQTKRATERQVRNAYRGVISNISQVQAFKQAVISNESALRAAQAGYEVGTRTTVDVLVARRNLFAAQRDYAQARYNYVLNTLQLHLAAGTLDMASLRTLDRWLR